MRDQELVNAIRRLKVETGSLACMGCGHEHNCGVSGCAVMREAADRIANQRTHIAALQQEIEKLRGRCPGGSRWRSGCRRIVAMSLLSRIDTKDGAPIWAGALPKGRHGLSMSALGTDPISPSRTGCRCRNRRRRKGK